tara:strand:- start:26380 stop:27393 length:1014 start_codon:yes stop_codon:yes gene_type:complete
MDVRKPLTKANILEKVSQFDIFNSYCSPFNALYKTFRSELRTDKNPTCSICRVGEKLIYKDFSESETRDCFDYIQAKYGVSFIQALEMVNRDFGLNLLSTVTLSTERVQVAKSDFDVMTIPEQVVDIRVCTRTFTVADKEFWYDRFGIHSATLEKFKIFPLSGFFVNGVYTQSGSNVYGYYFGLLPDKREAWKIYQPYADRKLKWRSNCPESIIQGWEQLPAEGDVVIITKSLKDVAVLTQLDFPSVAPQAESNTISPDLVLNLRKRYEHVMLLYDNDEPGKIAAQKIAEQHNLPVFFMPDETKDASDFVELYGTDELFQFITETYEKYSYNSQLGS